MVDSYY